MNLRELAQRLRLSPTTVSRALNGYPEVSETTRARVLEAARRYRYSPNAGARWLATGRSRTVSHIIPMRNQEEMLNLVFGDFIAGAGEVYGQNGYSMLLKVVPDEDEAETYRRIAEQRVADGFLLHGPVHDDPRLPLLTELGVPFVVHGRASGFAGDYSWLDVNNRQAFARATRYLLELGHRRLGLVNGIEAMDYARRRKDGFLEALEAAGIAPRPEFQASGPLTEPHGYAAASRMLELPDPPTAFLSAGFVPTLGIRRAIEARGLRPGRDVSVICFDDCFSALPNAGPDGPIFTALKSSIRDAGRHCARMLLDRIRDPAGAHVHDLWQADLVLGGSTSVLAGPRMQ